MEPARARLDKIRLNLIQWKRQAARQKLSQPDRRCRPKGNLKVQSRVELLRKGQAQTMEIPRGPWFAQCHRDKLRKWNNQLGKSSRKGVWEDCNSLSSEVLDIEQD